MTLNKRYLRNIKSNISFYISIIAVTAIVVYMYVAISAAYGREKEFLGENVEKVNREDGQFTLYKDMTDEELSKYENNWNVAIEKQQYIDMQLENNSMVRVFTPCSKVDRYIVSKGEDIASDGDILLSQLFAEANNIHIGDSISLDINGTKKDFKVSGFAIRFDYLFCLKNVNDTFSISSEFGVGIISENAFTAYLNDLPKGSENSYYAIVYNEDNEKEVRKELYKEYGVSSYTSADINNRIQTPNDQLDELEAMAHLILPVAIILVVILIAVVLGRKVKNERKMIGILNALGMTKFELARHYSIFGLIPGLLGSLMGMILGNATAGNVMDILIEGKLEPFNISFSSSISSSLLAVGLPTLCYAAAVFVTALLTIKGDPIDLIKGSGKSSIHKCFRFSKSRKMSFRTKYKIRAVLGNFGRTLTLLGGLAIGGLVLSFSLACVDSIQHYVDESVDAIGSFEYEYYLNTLMIEKDDENPLLDKGVGFLATSFGAENKNDIVTFMGIDDTKYLNLDNEDGRPLKTEEGKYYISSMGAMIYGVKKGDSLVLYDINSLEEYRITIDDIFENGSQNLIVTSDKTLSRLMGLYDSMGIDNRDVKLYNGIMSDTALDLENGIILKEVIHKDIKKQLEENILKNMKGMLGLVLVLGAGILIMIIFLMVNMLLTESTVTISMLKVLGYNDGEINSIITHIYHVVVAVGTLLGLALGIWVNDLNFKKSTSVYNCYVKSVIKPSSVMIYFGIAILSYVLSLLLLGGKVKKVSMVESLKDTRV